MCIIILCNSHGKGVCHYKIYNDGECFNLYGEDGFASVPELIDYYRVNEGEFLDENGENVDLNEPLVLETSAAPLQQERYDMNANQFKTIFMPNDGSSFIYGDIF